MLCCKHAYTLDNFCVGKIVSVPKKSNVCGSFSDYRSIATVNVLAKVFKYSLMNRLEGYIDLHELQFGFIMDGGCDCALLVF